jgi:hypothetical protein
MPPGVERDYVEAFYRLFGGRCHVDLKRWLWRVCVPASSTELHFISFVIRKGRSLKSECLFTSETPDDFW